MKVPDCKHGLTLRDCALCTPRAATARRLKDIAAVPIAGYVAADSTTRLAGAQSWETAPPVLLSTDYYGVSTPLVGTSRVRLAPVERPWWCKHGSFNPLTRVYVDGRPLDPEVPIEVLDSFGAPEY